jgi:hypothetical protein
MRPRPSHRPSGLSASPMPDLLAPVREGAPGHTSSAAARGGVAHRLLGALLILLATVPMYRLLAHEGTGLAGAGTVSILDLQFDMLWSGLLLLPILFLVGAMFGSDRLEHRLAGMGQVLAAAPAWRVAAGAALVSGLLGTLFALQVLEGLPNLIDAQAQLLHARWLAEGHLAGPSAEGAEFWALQNSVITSRGWVSQYPPGHVMVLALFMKLGVPWLAGPLLMAVTTFFSALAARRLLPGRPATAALGAIFLAVSPFFIGIGASYLNHVSAAAGVAVGAWALIRAWQGRMAWGVLAGLGFGFALASRPLSAVAMAGAVALTVLLLPAPDARPWRAARVWMVTALGALPFALGLAAYNSHFFGGPLTFGYNIALGPRMALGFHQDPWGNYYGLREALAYTSADLLSLGVHLLESPLSAVLLIGLFLVLQRRLTPGVVVLLGWALAPVVANAFYWHHGQFMGPRMLHEAAPAWAILAAVAVAGLIDRVPPAARFGAFRMRSGVLVTIAGALSLSMLFLAPQRLLSYGGDWLPSMRVPAAEVTDSALVFVHDSWGSRVTMTLASRGYRLDLLETLVRQNPLCDLHELSVAVFEGDPVAENRMLASLDTVPVPSRPDSRGELPTTIFGSAPTDALLRSECDRQLASDRLGSVSLPSLLWRGALPGSAAAGVMYVRDFGPERNRRLLDAYPQRTPFVYMAADAATATPVLLPYARGMELLWNWNVSAQ